jgi:uncharacterized membrane protein
LSGVKLTVYKLDVDLSARSHGVPFTVASLAAFVFLAGTWDAAAAVVIVAVDSVWRDEGAGYEHSGWWQMCVANFTQIA